MKEKLGELGVKLVDKDIWSSTCPDLNVFDYVIWSKFKQRIKGDRVCVMAQLEGQVLCQWPKVYGMLKFMLSSTKSYCHSRRAS